MYIQNVKLDNKYEIKFCILADIHHIKSCDKFYYQKLLNTIKNLEYNYLLIPGDLIDNPKIINRYEDLKPLIEFLESLAKVSPLIYTPGNHEMLFTDQVDIQKFYKILSNINNLYILNNQSLILDKFIFIGFNPQKEFISEYNQCNFKIPKNKICILIVHNPLNIIHNYKSLNNFKEINYVICGHMHNGLLPHCLEGIFKNRGIAGPHYKLFPSYCRGIYKLDDTQLIICKSLRVLTKDNLIYRLLDKCYKHNITLINI